MVAWLILGVVLLTVSTGGVAALGRVLPLVRVIDRGPLQQQVAATVIPNRVSPPAQQLAVSFWTPQPVKGELER